MKGEEKGGKERKGKEKEEKERQGKAIKERKIWAYFFPR